MSNRQLIRQVSEALLGIAGGMLLITVMVGVMGLVAVLAWPSIQGWFERRQAFPVTTAVATAEPAAPQGEGELRLITGEQHTWILDVPAHGGPALLSLEARMDFAYLAGGTAALEVLVNGEPVMGPRLINKPLDFQFSDGRTFAYFYPPNKEEPYNRWMVFYSPDFTGNTQPGSGYQVLSGEPYRYVFDIAPLIMAGRPNKISITNHSEAAAETLGKTLILVVRQVEVEGIPLRPVW